MNTLADNDLLLWMDADPLATVAEIEWFRTHAARAEEKAEDASERKEAKDKPCERCQKDREAA